MHYGTKDNSFSEDAMRISRRIVEYCMGVKPEESVLIVTDTIRKDLGVPIYQAALETGSDAIYMEMKPRLISGNEPPRLIADAMYDADVVIAVTSVSLTHTIAKKRAVEHGARIATMPFGSKGTEFAIGEFTRGAMTVDYEKMDGNIHRLAKRLEGTERVRLTTENGTDILIDCRGRKFYEETGLARHSGEFTNLPAGELYIAPVSANGIVVVDVTMGRLGKLTSPITLVFKNGSVESVKGERAGELETLLDRFGPNARKIAELGIGMNPKARICGLLVEDEKVMGTAHVALGNNIGFGGDVSVGLHLDGVIGSPTIYSDDEKIDIDGYR